MTQTDCPYPPIVTKPHGPGVFSAVGSSQGLLVRASFELQLIEHRDLQARFRLSAGERACMLIAFAPPETINQLAEEAFDWSCARSPLEQTQRWWEQWTARAHDGAIIDAQTLRSTLVLRGLMYEPTGAITAAATTSLPESIGTHRNSDYRFSWVGHRGGHGLRKMDGDRSRHLGIPRAAAPLPAGFADWRALGVDRRH